jgi:hypothetical protein
MTQDEREAAVKLIGKWRQDFASGTADEQQAAKHLEAAYSILAPKPTDAEAGAFGNESKINIPPKSGLNRMGDFQSQRRPWPGSR